MADTTKAPRAIAITFAGRCDRMSLLARCMARALECGVLDEWHVWNYAKDPADDLWIRGLGGEKVTVFGTEGSKYDPTKKTKQYEECYMSYTRDAYHPATVFVKIDDDVVYVDVEGLRKQIEYHRATPEWFILSANVVNNPTCYIMQNEMKKFLGIAKKELITSGDDATALHRAFLGGEDPAYDAIVDYNLDLAVNINCITWLACDLEAIQYADSTSTANDEVNLSCNFPKIFKRPAGIFGPCVVAHLSFHTQDAAMPIAELLDAYQNMVN